MERIIKILSAATLILVLASCNKKQQDHYLIQFNENIAGDYYYTTMDWYGPAVDLDGDGEASVNIAHELYGLNSDILPGKQKRTAARVLELQAPGIPNTISIDIPMQGVVKDPEDGSCHPSERMWATYSPQCVMNKDCNISFRNSESGSIANKIPLTKCMDLVKEAEMISLEPGYMHFTYKCVFYDFLTRSFVPGKVDAWLKRYTRADGSAL